MLCKKPFRQGTAEYGCGQCMPCRMNRRRVWTARIMLEAECHDESCFVTLTYAPDNLPVGDSLVVRDYQLFLKRLRRLIAPRRLRYFFVGEYGDDSQRPHYHAALFGVGLNDRDVIDRAWMHGFVHVGTLTSDSASYVVSYVTKRMTSPDDPRLNGRYPEFARMSLKPGIGHAGVSVISDALNSAVGAKVIAETGEIPASVRHNGKMYPIGRYLRSVLLDTLGVDTEVVQSRLRSRVHAERVQEIVDSGYDHREDVRKQHSRIAENRVKLSNSRKRLKL